MPGRVAALTDLPRIVSDIKDIEMIYLENAIAKYRIQRNHVIDGQTVQITNSMLSSFVRNKLGYRNGSLKTYG